MASSHFTILVDGSPKLQSAESYSSSDTVQASTCAVTILMPMGSSSTSAIQRQQSRRTPSGSLQPSASNPLTLESVLPYAIFNRMCESITGDSLSACLTMSTDGSAEKDRSRATRFFEHFELASQAKSFECDTVSQSWKDMLVDLEKSGMSRTQRKNFCRRVRFGCYKRDAEAAERMWPSIERK